MTRREKKKLQSDFLRKAGPNAATFKAAMDALPEVAFYMKDAEGRIMALNRRNCDICNIHDELDAVGLRSSDIFPGPLAQSYIANDQIVQKTRCIYNQAPSVDGAPDWHQILKPVTEHIAKHYAEDITVDGLAAMVETSPSNFRRQFTHTFGISPGRYLTAIRLNAARKLLETTDKLVSEIAVETGFWDQSHLTKLFKRERGLTPGEYRRRHRH